MPRPMRGLRIARPGHAAGKDAPRRADRLVGLRGYEMEIRDNCRLGLRRALIRKHGQRPARHGEDGGEGRPGNRLPRAGPKPGQSPAQHLDAKCAHQPEHKTARHGKGRPLARIAGPAGLRNHPHQKPDQRHQPAQQDRQPPGPSRSRGLVCFFHGHLELPVSPESSRLFSDGIGNF